MQSERWSQSIRSFPEEPDKCFCAKRSINARPSFREGRTLIVAKGGRAYLLRDLRLLSKTVYSTSLSSPRLRRRLSNIGPIPARKSMAEPGSGELL